MWCPSRAETRMSSPSLQNCAELMINKNKIVADLEKQLRDLSSYRPVDLLSVFLSKGAYIYGAGVYGRRIAALMRNQGFPCLGFIDRKVICGSQDLDGLPVFHPASITPAQAAQHCFVLGLHNHYLDVRPILAYARNLNFQTILLNADLPDVLGSDANSYWMVERRFLLENIHRLSPLVEALSDQGSIDVLCNLLRFRMTGNYDFHPSHDLKTQYLPPELPGFNCPITMVDGGAFAGDTLMALGALNVRFKQIFAFEPDPANFERLTGCVRRHNLQASLFPCGLSDRFEQVFFQDAQGLGSHIVEDAAQSSRSVLCVALDDVVQGTKPDYIKLDIEGAELAALKGMSHTVASARPRMAVSAYHRPGDLWDIAEQLHSMLPAATLHLRQHGFSGFDSVLYALPPQ
jgi:FkbM family methyltransferase